MLLGFLLVPGRPEWIPTNRGSHCRNLCRDQKIRDIGAAEFLHGSPPHLVEHHHQGGEARDARNRLADGAGLFLRLFVKGASHGWRFDYSLNGRRNTLSLGAYPERSPESGAQKAEEARSSSARALIQRGAQKVRDAAVQQRTTERRAAAGLPPVDSFEAVAREWHTKNVATWAPSHSIKINRRLEQDVFPWIGSKPVGSIRPMELLTLLKRVESGGAVETTHRVQQNCGQVFRYAVATGRADSDPSRDLRGALPPGSPRTTRRLQTRATSAACWATSKRTKADSSRSAR